MLFVLCSESETSLPRITQIYNSGQRFRQIQISSVQSPPAYVFSETKAERFLFLFFVKISLTSEPWVTGARVAKGLLTVLVTTAGVAVGTPPHFIYQSPFKLR